MKNKDHINHEVNKTLESFDGITPAEANPYLYSKIRERMIDSYDAIPVRLKWLSIGLAASLALAVFVMKNNQQSTQSNVEVFAEEFSLDVSTYNF